MSDDLAALAEPTSIAYQAVRRSGIEAGQVAVIFGAGAIGLLIAQILVRGRGCRAYVVDLDPARLEVAEALGARPLHGSRDALVQAISAATGGELADVVFEATGSAVCTRMTTDLVGHGGRIVLIGWNKGPVEVDTVTLMRKEVDLFGSRNSANAFPAVLRLLADGVIDASRMVTHHYELGETTAALELLDRGEAQAVKILVHRA
jgi:threonine dehydrogenase-like Zn-dependent dehydrogenase